MLHLAHKKKYDSSQPKASCIWGTAPASPTAYQMHLCYISLPNLAFRLVGVLQGPLNMSSSNVGVDRRLDLSTTLAVVGFAF